MPQLRRVAVITAANQGVSQQLPRLPLAARERDRAEPAGGSRLFLQHLASSNPSEPDAVSDHLGRRGLAA